MVLSALTEWILHRPKWLQEATKRLLERGTITDDDISELAELCKREAEGDVPDIDCSIPKHTLIQEDQSSIRLRSISDIEGINRLAPRKPLDFGSSDMAIVYGSNGSGKSGYVRLLKQVCGSPISEPILNDVFSPEKTTQKAKLVFQRNDDLVTYEWTGTGVCEELSGICIFDTSYGRIFLDDENEVSYEPPVLSFFSLLIEVCEKVSEKLDAELERYSSKKLTIPRDLIGTPEMIWFSKISAKTSLEEIKAKCSFTDEDEEELLSLTRRLTEPSPADKAQELQKKKAHIDSMIKDIEKHLDQLSDDSCKSILLAKETLKQKKSAAEVAATNMFDTVQLEGIGSEVWMELWRAAEKYSNEIAYKGQRFPVVEGDSLCVLCQQPLSEEAQERFLSFEVYIKSETQRVVNEAEERLKSILDSIEEVPSREVFRTRLDAAGLENDELNLALLDTIDILRMRREQLLVSDCMEELPIVSVKPSCIEELREIAKEHHDLFVQYSEDAQADNCDEQRKAKMSLEARKWLAMHKEVILEEIDRLQKLDILEKAKRTTNSTAISRKKGELAESLITEAFVERFNDELKALGASRIRVKLVKAKVTKGRVLHKLELDGSDHPSIIDVLSEGERRIVSIAAFLADLTGRNAPIPCVFDDPISSLDHIYEEAVVKRLCALSRERQIIVFTHRLSLSSLLQSHSKEQGLNAEFVVISHESWGAGDPVSTSPFLGKPDRVLKNLINEDLARARKALAEQGTDVYRPLARYLCASFRNLLERVIEAELLSGVVLRYRRGIQTKHIVELSAIELGDCMYLDSLMGEYSKYAHSQPLEMHIAMPEPDKLERDFKDLLAWIDGFKSRKNQARRS